MVPEARVTHVNTKTLSAAAGWQVKAAARAVLAGWSLDRILPMLQKISDAPLTEHHGLARVGARVPHGVVCLLSALQFHDIGTQSPSDVWLALPRGTWEPRCDWPPMRFVRLSGPALTALVQEHVVEGIRVRVYSPAKTVVDCFRFRNKIGLDVALEALRDCLKQRKASIDDLWKAAKVCRVAGVMRPYLESLA